MKSRIMQIATILVAAMSTSCVSTSSFYQIYRVTPSEKMETREKALFYEDQDIKISYNLWSEGGNMGFRFYNKSDEDIFLNMENTYFILNGVAHDYYKNRVFTRSIGSSKSASNSSTASKSETGFNYLDLLQTNKVKASMSDGLSTSSKYSVSFNEEKIICIPSQTSKEISEYNISETLYRDCDLFRYPRRTEIKSKSFSKTESPIIFSNRIAYTIGKSDVMINLENEFYISEVTNYPENEILESRREEYCGQVSVTSTRYIKDVSPSKFYNKYSKGEDNWKH